VVLADWTDAFAAMLRETREAETRDTRNAGRAEHTNAQLAAVSMPNA